MNLPRRSETSSTKSARFAVFVRVVDVPEVADGVIPAGATIGGSPTGQELSNRDSHRFGFTSQRDRAPASRHRVARATDPIDGLRHLRSCDVRGRVHLPARTEVMLYILAKRHIQTLASFATSNVLLAFDYDGTLAPIAVDPAVAPMRASTRRLLATLAGRYPCVVISGRARNDLVKRVAKIPVFHLSGNHGLEPWAQHSGYRTLVQDWVRRLGVSLASCPGVVIEDKTYSG
jgi:hypothetical protein